MNLLQKEIFIPVLFNRAGAAAIVRVVKLRLNQGGRAHQGRANEQFLNSSFILLHLLLSLVDQPVKLPRTGDGIDHDVLATDDDRGRICNPDRR